MILVAQAHGCAVCGFKKYWSALDFHHVGPKRFTISGNLFRRLDSIIDELAECVVLCACCHRAAHHGELSVDLSEKKLDKLVVRDILQGSKAWPFSKKGGTHGERC